MHMLRWGEQNLSICNFSLSIERVCPIVPDVSGYLYLGLVTERAMEGGK